MKIIKRFFLDINSSKDIKFTKSNLKNIKVECLIKPNFLLNKFFYTQIGKKYSWKDRLEWKDKEWQIHTSNENLCTWVVKVENEYAGYAEIYHHKNESEILFFGILDEYIGKKLGGYFLSYILNKCFSRPIERAWVHTCNLDHKNALKNYRARGMKIFDQQTLEISY